jgi:hypothetical protein
MGTELYSTFWGRVDRTGPWRATFHYPGRAYTGLLVAVLCFWLVGVVAMLVGGAADREWGAVGGGVLGLGACAVMAAWIRFRVRRMGTFVVDAEAGTLEHRRGRSRRGIWPLSEVAFSRQWDPTHRGFEIGYWLVARVPDGRGLRLAKGPAAALDPLLALLASWGVRRGTP